MTAHGEPAGWEYGLADILCSILTGPHTKATATKHHGGVVVIEFRDSSLFDPDEAVIIDVVRRRMPAPTGRKPTTPKGVSE